MSAIEKFHFSQERGRWVAHCDSPVCEEVLGTRTLPVMRDFRDGQWNWSRPVRFRGNPDQFGRAWWNDTGQELWRELLLSGVPVLVRHATPATEAAPTGSVGEMIGIFQTANVVIAEDVMTLELVKRLAEAT